MIFTAPWKQDKREIKEKEDQVEDENYEYRNFLGKSYLI